MKEISLVYTFLFITTYAMDLNHLKKGLRLKRETNDVPQKFLNSINQPDVGLVILLDTSMFVPKSTFYGEMLDFTAYLIRYHVFLKYLAIMTFSDSPKTVINKFNNDFNKCELFEGPKYWYNIAYDENKNVPDYDEALTTVQANYTIKLVVLIITSGNDGSMLSFSPASSRHIELFVAETSTTANTSELHQLASDNYTSINTWMNRLKSYNGNVEKENIQDWQEFGGPQCNGGEKRYCNVFSGVSFCSNSCPVKTNTTTTGLPVLDRIEASCYSPCLCSTCESPYGESVCVCDPGFIGLQCKETICDACPSSAQRDVCNAYCSDLPGKTVPLIAIIIPCAVGGFLILIIGVSLLYSCNNNRNKRARVQRVTERASEMTGARSRSAPPVPDLNTMPQMKAPSSRPGKIRETTAAEDNQYAAYGKIPRHENMENWLGYIEEMVTIGHMEAAAIFRFDNTEWVCSERAFKINQREYDVLCRLLDKRAPNYKVKFKRKEYFLIENDGETMVMESLQPKGHMSVVIARTLYFLIAVKVTRIVGVEAAKNEITWVKSTIQSQEFNQ